MQTVIGGKVAPAAAAKIRIRTGWERASIDKTTESGRDGGGEPGDPDRQPAIMDAAIVCFRSRGSSSAA